MINRETHVRWSYSGDVSVYTSLEKALAVMEKAGYFVWDCNDGAYMVWLDEDASENDDGSNAIAEIYYPKEETP